MYHFTRDDEGLAWRMIGLAARHCIELGLHRRETYATLFPDPDEQASAIRIFWSVYVLDRRWSLGTGMPFALQDADLDHNLPKPVRPPLTPLTTPHAHQTNSPTQDVSTHTSTPYLNAMISYSAIGSKVWKSVASTSPSSPSDLKISKEDISFLDFQVLNWHRSIPSPLKFTHPDSLPPASGTTPSPSPSPPRVIHRLQILLYLRANQMRILIYRPVLHTATTILSHLDFAHTVVKVAKDTIRILTHINRTSDIYRVQQTMFNYFLISALAVLFLAVAHAPAEFSPECRDEFYNALDLVRGLSGESYVSKRLWRTVRTLKEVGPRLGLVSREMLLEGEDGGGTFGHGHGHGHGQHLHQHEHQEAAVAMAGLAAGHGHAHGQAQRGDMAAYRAGNASVHNNASHAVGVASASSARPPTHLLPDPAGPVHHLDTPHGMALDLTTLFEAAGGTFNLNGFDLSNGAAGGGADGYGDGAGGGTAGGGGHGMPAYGQENDELSRILRDLF